MSILLYSCTNYTKVRKPSSVNTSKDLSCKELILRMNKSGEMFRVHDLERIIREEEDYRVIFENDLLHHEEKLYYASVIQLLEKEISDTKEIVIKFNELMNCK